jgi:hypothetical protein
MGARLVSQCLLPLDPYFDSVIDGLDEVLLGAEVAFGGLDGGVPQE